MLYIDVGNTLRGGLRTGIQRVVRALAFHIAADAPLSTRLIAFDVAQGRYFSLADPGEILSADRMDAIAASKRRYFDFAAFKPGDVFFEPDSTWTEPLNRGSLYRLLKQRSAHIVILNHDVIPVLLPEVCHPNTLVAFPETIAEQMIYADCALATSAKVEADLVRLMQRLTDQPVPTRVIKLGSDFGLASLDASAAIAAALQSSFPELAGLRFLLSVGTVEPRKNHQLLLDAFADIADQDAAMVIVGRKGWMADAFLAAYRSHPDYGKRLFWYNAIDDRALCTLYANAEACVLPSLYEGYGLPAVEALSLGCATICSDAGALPETTQGRAALFRSGDRAALHALLLHLYQDEAYRAELKARAREFRPTSWTEAAASVRQALDEVAAERRR